MDNLYPINKVRLRNKNLCMTVYGKDAKLISIVAKLILICITITAFMKAIK